MALKEDCEHTDIWLICPQCDGKDLYEIDSELTVLSRIRAQFDSSCHLCSKRIQEGDSIALVEDDDGERSWVHPHHVKADA